MGCLCLLRRFERITDRIDVENIFNLAFDHLLEETSNRFVLRDVITIGTKLLGRFAEPEYIDSATQDVFLGLVIAQCVPCNSSVESVGIAVFKEPCHIRVFQGSADPFHSSFDCTGIEFSAAKQGSCGREMQGTE